MTARDSAENDLPAGYRWATAEEAEDWENVPGIIVVPRTVDADGNPYTQDEADLAVPLTRVIPPVGVTE